MNPKLGVIVPYRDREKHLKKFIPHITDFLNEHTIPFEILVVEQADDLPFNRGRLLNVGFDILEEIKDFYTDIEPRDCYFMRRDMHKEIDLERDMHKEIDLEKT